MSKYVDFDPDLAIIGAIEPEFVEVEHRIDNPRRLVIDPDQIMATVFEVGSELPVRVLTHDYEDIEPIIVTDVVLKWRDTLAQPSLDYIPVEYVGHRRLSR